MHDQPDRPEATPSAGPPGTQPLGAALPGALVPSRGEWREPAGGLASWRWPLGLGIIAWLAVVGTLWDPGITSDEPFNVSYGKYFVARLLERGWGFFDRQSVDEVFTDRSEHPPLGRWLIGWTHHLLDPDPRDPTLFSIPNARLAPATAFAILLMLVSHSTAVRHGQVAGVSAGLALLLMPRLFAHAHLAALDTLVSCTYTMGILGAAWMMGGSRPWLRAPLAGILLGCALLTKIHGFLLLPVVFLWALAFYRARAGLPMAIWMLVGFTVFFAGWPWLWRDVSTLWMQWRGGGILHSEWFRVLPHTFARLSAFLSSSVIRDSISVLYLGVVYRDSLVPWHYPWVLFAVTVPVGLHALGLVGLADRLRGGFTDRSAWLGLAALVFPLVLFSLPRVPVYDGERLFLMAFPLWAVNVGLGTARLLRWLLARWPRAWAYAALAGFFVPQAYGVWHHHPFQLSYFNLLVGGLRGADRLGFEVTYWGDSITPRLIDRWSELAPEGACAVLVPTLHEAQVFLYATERTIQKGQKIRGSPLSACPYFILYNRRPYLSPEAREVVRRQEPLAVNSVDGVWLGAVYPRPTPQAGDREPGRAGEGQ